MIPSLARDRSVPQFCAAPVATRPARSARFPHRRPILAVGADLKNTITLVVDGQAFVSQHIGDLEHYESLEAFRETIQDLISMYEVDWDELLVIHDLHPQYFSSIEALELPAARKTSRPASSRAYRLRAC